jgi:hypothetical protein
MNKLAEGQDISLVLLHTCRKAYLEAVTIFYKHNVFELRKVDTLSETIRGGTGVVLTYFGNRGSFGPKDGDRSGPHLFTKLRLDRSLSWPAGDTQQGAISR